MGTKNGTFFVSLSYNKNADHFIYMADKVEYLMVRVTLEQKKIIEAKARNAGFKRKSDYVRSLLFIEHNTSEMIKKIYDKVVKDGL